MAFLLLDDYLEPQAEVH